MITIAEAKRHYEQADAVHDFDHVLRVLALAEHIGRAEGANLEIVQAAALLHDAGRGKAETDGLDHAAVAADRARTILAEHLLAKAEAVAHAIAAHRFCTGPEPSTLEAQVLFDADKLDAIGAVGVARAFAYEKLKRKVGDYATAAAAVVLTMNGDTCQSASVALTNVGQTPLFAAAAGQALVGTKVDEAAVTGAVEAAKDIAEPVADMRGPEDYRIHAAGVMARRAIERALARARG